MLRELEDAKVLDDLLALPWSLSSLSWSVERMRERDEQGLVSIDMKILVPHRDRDTWKAEVMYQKVVFFRTKDDAEGRALWFIHSWGRFSTTPAA